MGRRWVRIDSADFGRFPAPRDLGLWPASEGRRARMHFWHTHQAWLLR